jgi:ABC-type dipeptide/oligopeptide/nickel transport system permease subunit
MAPAISLFIGLVVVGALSPVVGIVLGLLAGYFRGWVDVVIMRVMDIILAFPSLLLALVLVAILGPGLLNAMLAIALVCSRTLCAWCAPRSWPRRTATMSPPPRWRGPAISA